MRREVVRIVTPGTPIDPQLLEAREPVFLAAICSAGETIGAAFLDISTGEFRVTQETGVIRGRGFAPRSNRMRRASCCSRIARRADKSSLTGKIQTAPCRCRMALRRHGALSRNDAAPGRFDA